MRGMLNSNDSQRPQQGRGMGPCKGGQRRGQCNGMGQGQGKGMGRCRANRQQNQGSRNDY